GRISHHVLQQLVRSDSNPARVVAGGAKALIEARHEAAHRTELLVLRPQLQIEVGYDCRHSNYDIARTRQRLNNHGAAVFSPSSAGGGSPLSAVVRNSTKSVFSASVRLRGTRRSSLVPEKPVSPPP